jgi:selenocysteine-specific elongation factor
MSQLPLTLGTAGHVDHGKTALVRALTGVDTDRLPDEHRRGISIVLGYASLTLPSGRRVSVVDVPGHERFVRTMVAGATGIDAYVMTVAADDGVMPQTREHAAVLRGLAVERGLVAITKTDLADPERARGEVADLLPGVPVVAVSARTGAGLDDLLAALDELAAGVPSRALSEGPALLHVDRAFTIRGAGTVVTGTLQRGSIGRGDVLRLLPRDEPVRVRGVQVHDEPTDRAPAGQRVAVNLTGVDRDRVARGDVLAGAEAALEQIAVVDAELEVPADGMRVQVHHGTRETAARVRRLDGALHRLRLERPLIAAPGDRLVVRWISPPGTAGGGLVVAAYPPGAAPRGRRPPAAAAHAVEGAAAAAAIETRPATAAAETAPATAAAEAAPARAPAETASPTTAPGEGGPFAIGGEAAAVEEILRAAAHEPPLDRDLDADALRELRAAGRAVPVARTMHFHVDALADVERRVRAIVEAEGQIDIARLREELHTSRKFSRALLEHFDNTRVTLRRPDDTRVLRRKSRPPPGV